MATAATSLLGLALPVTGELSGTWGDTVNVSITALLDTAVAGTTTLSSDADVTLTTTTLAANQARQAIILWTAGGTVTRTITVPAQSKSYIVINKTSSSQSIKIVGVGPTTGVTIVAGTAAFVVWNGVDFVTASVTSTTGILPVANGGTGLSSGTSGGVLAYTAAGTLASSAALAASALVIGGGAGAAPSTTTTGTGVVTALGVNTGTAGAFVVNGGALGSPSSVGTMPAFTLGGTVSGGGNQINNVEIGASSALAGAFTTLTASSTLTVTGAGSIEGLTVGKGGGAVATNTAVGASALAANTSGSVNAAFGSNSLSSNTSGGGNAAFGPASLQNNTTGGSNTALGYLALTSNSTGSFNIAVGQQTLNSNTTASNNTAVGYQAGYSNTTAQFNTFIGYESGLNSNRTADTNGYNTFVGYRSGLNVSTGQVSVFIGSRSGSSGASRITGSGNTSVGDFSGNSLEGAAALNAFFGQNSGAVVTTGTKNTIIGSYTGNQGGLDIRTASNYIVLSDGDGNPRGIFDSYGTFAVGTTQNLNYGYGISFGVVGRGLLLQQSVNTNDERVYLTNNAQTRTASGFTGDFSYNKTGASATAYYSSGGYVQFLGADPATAGDTISWTNLFAVSKGVSVALQGASNASGTGISFPGTQNASSNANTLDDYEEGTWSPMMGDLSGNNFTMSIVDGRYTKIGNQVTVSLIANWTSIGSVTSSGLRCTLPFACDSSNYARFSAAIGYMSGFDTTLGTKQLTSNLDQGIAYLTFYQTNDNTVPTILPADSCSTSGGFQATITYFV